MQNVHDELGADDFKDRLKFYDSGTHPFFLLILVLLESLLFRLLILFFMDFLKRKTIIIAYLFYVYRCFVCMDISTPERGDWDLWNYSHRLCEPPCGCWDWNSGLLGFASGRTASALNAEPSLQPYYCWCACMMREGVHGACPCACVGVKGPLCGVRESQGSYPSHQAFIASDIKLLSVFPVSVMDSMTMPCLLQRSSQLPS